MLGPYGALFATADARRLVAASAVERLAIGAFGLPLLLAVQQATGSFAVAGVVVGAFSLGVAVFAPLRGRLVDRHGAARVLPPMALVSGAGLVLVAATAEAVPGAVLAAFSLVAGASTPPGVAAMRLEWQRILGTGDPRLAQAYAWESGLQTALFVIGPLLGAAGIALIGARVTLALSAALLVVGTFAFVAFAAAPPAGERAGVSPIRRPGVLTLVLATMLADAGMGAVDVAVPAFASERGAPELAGVLIAFFAAGSVAGALVYGARVWPLASSTQLVLISVAAAVLLAILAVPSSAVVLGAVLFVAGAPSAAQWSSASFVLDRVSGGQAGAEAFTWLSSANAVGIAVGSVAAGAAVEAWGTEAAFLLAAVGPACAAILLAARRATLDVAPGGALD